MLLRGLRSVFRVFQLGVSSTLQRVPGLPVALLGKFSQRAIEGSATC